MDYAAARYNMVQQQLRTNRVTDPMIVAAMSTLPREGFIPQSHRGLAYVDEDIPLGTGRFMPAPLTTARLLQAAEIDAADVILEIGCGTGYATAVMAGIASVVVALECDADLAAKATAILAELDLNTVTVTTGPLPAGHPEQAPYDVIVFGGAVASVPPAITQQLADGGRMLAVIAGEKGLGCGTLFLRRGESISRRTLFDVSLPLLPGFVPEPMFRF
ncbi:MAG: protein-L-isoaspartate O-methyltransferase [Rhodospirillales bacterium]|nr:protein-L-isoaspartate O-methyltransferase [Rhodospirillales bacterium]